MWYKTEFTGLVCYKTDNLRLSPQAREQHRKSPSTIKTVLKFMFWIGCCCCCCCWWCDVVDRKIPNDEQIELDPFFYRRIVYLRCFCRWMMMLIPECFVANLRMSFEDSALWFQNFIHLSNNHHWNNEMILECFESHIERFTLAWMYFNQILVDNLFNVLKIPNRQEDLRHNST